MKMVSSLFEATFFRTRQNAHLAAADAGSYEGHHIKFDGQYEVVYQEYDIRRKGWVVLYHNGMYLTRRYNSYVPRERSSSYRGGTKKRKKGFHADEDYDGINHPLRGLRRQKIKEYDIETDIPVPDRIIDTGHESTVPPDHDSFPFDFLEEGYSFLAIGLSRKKLMVAYNNWHYKRNRFGKFYDFEQDKIIKLKVVVSEVHENGEFIGSRIWLIKKNYINP